MQEIAQLESRGWVVAYPDGSAKTVPGWAQLGYGVFYATTEGGRARSLYTTPPPPPPAKF